MSGASMNGTRWKKLKSQAYYRDMRRQAACWICGEPIDYTLPPGHPYAYEPDHYLNRRDYPEATYDITNLWPAHAHCNRSRGAAAPGEKKRPKRISAQDGISDSNIGKPSRPW